MSAGAEERITSKSPEPKINTELSSRRTGMSFQVVGIAFGVGPLA